MLHADPDEAFGDLNFGFYFFAHMCAMIGHYWRVMPMSGVVLVAGLGVAELLRHVIHPDGLGKAMPILLSVTLFFPQYCIAQEMINARQAHLTVCERFHSIVAAAQCLKDRDIVADVQSACIGVIYGQSRDPVMRARKTAGEAAFERLYMHARSDSPDADKIVGIVSTLHLVVASTVNGSLAWCTASLLDITLATLIIPLPISLLVVMQRHYIVVLAVLVIAILGVYDTALAGTNPLNHRFSSPIKRIVGIVNTITK